MATHDVGLTPPRLEYVGTALVYRIGDSRVERFFPAGEASPNPAGGRPVGEGVVGHSSEEATPAEPRLARTVSARTQTDGGVGNGLGAGDLGGVEVVETVVHLPKGAVVVSLRDLFALRGDVEFAWMPHLAPRDRMLVGDMVFRSPAMVFAGAGQAVALIPDLDHLEKAPVRLPAVMDLDRRDPKGGRLYYGYTPYRPADRHVYFEPDEDRVIEAPEGRLVLRYELLSAPVPRPQASLERVSRYLWERFGRAHTADALLRSKGAEFEGKGHEASTGPAAGMLDDRWVQFAPLETYAAYAYDWAFERWKDVCWHEFELDGRRVGAVVFIVTAEQSPGYGKPAGWREAKSIWNQAWFSSLRSAYGYYLWGKAWNRPDLIERARLAKEFALAAPQKEGLFPGYYVAGEDGSWETGRWVRSSNRKPPFHEAYYHLVDSSWTALWMLRWYRDLEKDERLRAYVTAYIERLLSLQLPSGAFPSWVHGETGDASHYLRESPQTAMHVLLLSEWAGLTGNERALEAAKKGAEFLISGPIPQGRWEDFETYWSCSREWEMKVYGVRDPKSGLYAQCNFSIYWTAEALCALYEQTRDERYLQHGVEVLGELSLYQQIWNPPYIDIPAFGGFGVMNTDGEWNDARQSLIALTYLRYFRHTGRPDHFERGVAALRAAFTMMYAPENATVSALYQKRHPHFSAIDYGFCVENYAHGGVAGVEGIGPFTIFDWGCGSAAATAAMVREAYGDVYVDAERRLAFGINGCSAAWTPGGVEIHEWLGRERELRVVVSGRGERRVRVQGGSTTVVSI